MHPFLLWATRRMQSGDFENGSGPDGHGTTWLKLAPKAARRFILGMDGLPFIGLQASDFIGLNALPWSGMAGGSDAVMLSSESFNQYGQLRLVIPSTGAGAWMRRAGEFGKVKLQSIEVGLAGPVLHKGTSTELPLTVLRQAAS
jgi:hypothetical protein